MRATAAEQNVPEAVTATEADLLNMLDFAETITETHRDDLSQPDRFARPGKVLLILTSVGDIAGMAMYFFTYNAWTAKRGLCLEDLYILPQYRSKRYARILVRAVAQKGLQHNCSRMEWLCYKDNAPALRFYGSIGAKEMTSLTFLRLDGKAMIDFTDESISLSVA